MRFQIRLLITILLIIIAGCSKPPQAPNTLTDAEIADGWKLLWDGKTTNGWRAIYEREFPATGWIIEDDALICKGEELPDSLRPGAVITTEKYGSFELSLEFKIQTGANNGIKYFIDESLPGSPGHGLGLEYQLLDDNNWPYEEPGLARTCASLYDLVHAKNKITKPIGEWNLAGIVVKGNHIEHWLNGGKVLEIEKGSPEYRELVSKSKYKDIEGWGEFPEGHILLQDEGPRTAFRNIKIKAL